ncbi:KIN14R [Symbiodinium necroappetens]|uniref:KIN14R protein n=1 Tax=Symbiodinium necroappetens TaxID=1628268 RepID=A0A812MGA5_9DINO|nr:KIN14R [Symbiodinium necroappetens]
MAVSQKRPAAATRSARKEVAGGPSADGGPKGEQRREVNVIEISDEEETSEDAAPSEGYCCYVLRSDNSARARTYTGITTDLKRRLRQHNGELCGGARATRCGGPWRVLCMVKGFPTKEDAARFEWRAKRQRAASSRKLVPLKGGLHRRCQNLCDVLRAERWTKSSRPARELPLAVTWFGGAPWQRVALPSYISTQCLEGDFQPSSSNKRRKRRISKDVLVPLRPLSDRLLKRAAGFSTAAWATHGREVMAEKLFQKPKVYDPTMADRSMLPPTNSRMQQMMDLGFDDANMHPEMEEKYSQLAEQLEAAQSQLQEAQAEMNRARGDEAKMALKLQSFQQVNRSQNALVRGELQKTRRKLAHMQSVAQRLKDQAAWLQAKSPNLSLPGELQGMPTEEEAAEEHAELAQLHERWEKDVAQLALDLEGRPRITGSAAEGSQEAQTRIEQLEQLAKKQAKQLDQQGKELEYFKGGAQASPSSSETLSTSGSFEEVASLRKDLEAAEEKTKEQVKKLKQLATAQNSSDKSVPCGFNKKHPRLAALMELRLNGLSGFICSLHCDVDSTILDVKTCICSLTEIPCIEQQLIYGSRELRDEEVLGKLGAAPGLSLELVLLREDPARAKALQSVRSNGLSLETLPEPLCQDRDIVLAAVKNTGFAILHAPPELRADREIALTSVRDRGFVLRYLDDSLKADREIVMAAVANDAFAVRHAAEPLKADREVALSAVTTHGSAVQYVSATLAEDREIALAAVKSSGAALRYLAPPFRKDREVVLAAVCSYGQALKFVLDEDLKRDPEIALTAVKSDFVAFQHVAPELAQTNPLIALAAVKQSAKIFKSLPDSVKSDREVALAAVSNDGFLLNRINEHLQIDRDIVLAAVSNSAVLGYACPEMRDDREVVMAAVRQEGTMLQYASGSLKSDAEVVLAAVKQNGFAVVYADRQLRSRRDVFLEAVRSSGSVLQWAAPEFREDLQIACAAVASNPSAVMFVAEDLKQKRRFWLAALRRNPAVAEFLPKRFRRDQGLRLLLRSTRSARLRCSRRRVHVKRTRRKTGLLPECLWTCRPRPGELKAYKKLDSEKGDLEAKLRTAGGRALPPQVVAKVQSAIAAGKKQVSEMRATVAVEIQQQLPQVLEEVMRSKAAELQKLLDKGSQEWKEKYAIECDRRRKLHNLVQELKGLFKLDHTVGFAAAKQIQISNADMGTKKSQSEMSTADILCLRACCVIPERLESTAKGSLERALARHRQSVLRSEMSLLSCVSKRRCGAVADDPSAGIVRVEESFQFNEIYRQNSSQEDLFTGIRDLVVSMLDGYNVCMFAYGQTGSGKTHSMQGTRDNPGVYTRTFNELFKVAKERTGWKIELKGACVEIYNEEIRDLLGPGDKKQKLQVRQGKEGNYVPGLTMQPVNNAEEVEMLLSTAQTNRTVAATDMNLHSSRSHLAVQILGTMTNPDGKQFLSAITLVDLAGSERLAKSGVAGDRAKEAIAINKSLSALGDVIAARAQKQGHTPYRNSVLTHFLQDSLGGDSKTLMLLQLNPCGSHVEESMCSLNFGARVNAVEMKK